MQKEDVLNIVRQGASDNEELSKLLHLVNTCPKPEIWDGLQAAEVLGVLRVALQKDTAGLQAQQQAAPAGTIDMSPLARNRTFLVILALPDLNFPVRLFGALWTCKDVQLAAPVIIPACASRKHIHAS